jgi:hypothetical protein
VELEAASDMGVEKLSFGESPPEGHVRFGRDIIIVVAVLTGQKPD